MSAHIRANLWLLVLSIVLCCVLYPLILLVIGQTMFHDKAQGSLLTDANGNVIGSRLIAQPFTSDEYFQPRPSSASYNGAASGATNWGANNYLLRDRVARHIGTHREVQQRSKKGQLAAADIEAWFQKDQFGGKPGIVAQWADAHNRVAQNWVGTTFDAKNPTPQQQFVLDWEKAHPDVVAKFKTDNPDNQDPAPADLADGLLRNLLAKRTQENSSRPSPKPALTANRRPPSSRSPMVPTFNRPFSTCGFRNIPMSSCKPFRPTW